METAATGSILLLLAAVVGLAAGAPEAFADHSEIIIEHARDGGMHGCEDTDEGCFIPPSTTSDVGSVIVFLNTDTVPHTFTSGTTQDGPDGIFDSGLVYPDSSYEYKTETVGEIPYYCQAHPWMTGKIIVQDDGDHGSEGEKPHIMNLVEFEPPTATGVLPDGTQVYVWSQDPVAGQPLEYRIAFDADSVSYDLLVTQNDQPILADTERLYRSGDIYWETTDTLPSDDGVDITITFQGYADRDDPGPVGEEVVFTNMVPEFGTIAMIVLAVAIISIIAVTAKSRAIPRL